MNSARIVALAGYFGLLSLLLLWFTWLAPPERFPVSLAILITTGPLLFALRGLLHARPYTHAWVSMLSLAYFTHGVVEAWANAAVRHLALLEVLFSVLLFCGAVLYVRLGRSINKT
jgi:uncharacterized membrane protein